MPHVRKSRVSKVLAWLAVINMVLAIFYGVSVDLIEVYHGFILALLLIVLNVLQVLILVSQPKGMIQLPQDMYLVLPVVFCNISMILVISRYLSTV
ncbi:hypothetical protein [Vibrio sp. B1FLJ16]|uniref:hypothetical protein n=1 Tax=Vibrio sp. B1FLJ16 TaxID=2751178 RepID=UPI0015F7777C|nr:hypothetical protein [Vibrio sp. B1FLJ16]MCA0934895.1 hypothetical protein [Vibrio alginolyticus]CAD7811029.1 hypothetical protein ACOMICROBIO_FLGHMIGD_02281 [Vibrio sp. B1FLJ16]CAD7811802.1 hypothetical protein ACOMICROBIO_EPCKBFOG_02409 [Vibrio sp. B1FLJ16]CAE6913881.1 hypothetical protein ACOMICROBIO_FLGHMIGD_02281 [Vibrio sp. B1FLJ16]CAE6917205.1 hypothetical protein ACOMICROBIO_EPCKBFOG_02409 [Vibrio sp. B1FLJ16]